VTVTGNRNYATDVINIFDGYDSTTDTPWYTTWNKNVSIINDTVTLSVDVQQPSYIYVTYQSISSYGSYVLTYTTISGSFTSLPSVDDVLCVRPLLLSGIYISSVRHHASLFLVLVCRNRVKHNLFNTIDCSRAVVNV